VMKIPIHRVRLGLRSIRTRLMSSVLLSKKRSGDHSTHLGLTRRQIF